MNETDLTQFKQKLETELAGLTEQLSLIGTQSESGDWSAKANQMDQETPEFDETADRIEEFQENIAVLEELEPRYESVQAALKRIEAGNYGICRISGEPIERARLEADPAADTTITNKEA